MVEPASTRAASGSARAAAVAASRNKTSDWRNAVMRRCARRTTASPSLHRRRTLRSGIFLEELEGPQAAAGRHVGQVGVASAHDIGPRRTTGDGQILLAVVFPGDRLPDDAGRGLEFPENFTGLAVNRHELASEPARAQPDARPHDAAGKV